MGPALGSDFSTSIELLKQLMDGELPGIPNLHFGIVDVRDVADLHLRAMTQPAAKGERFLATAGLMSIAEVAQVLRERMGDAARRVPSRVLPDWLLRFAALVLPTARQIAPDLGKVRDATGEKAQRVLGWQPRSKEDAIAATAESLVRLGLLRDSAQ
jgi:nucleoside-diphosphate-sugar epimerase